MQLVTRLSPTSQAGFGLANLVASLRVINTFKKKLRSNRACSIVASISENGRSLGRAARAVAMDCGSRLVFH